MEEKKQVEKTCAAYQDIFHLLGEMLTPWESDTRYASNWVSNP